MTTSTPIIEELEAFRSEQNVVSKGKLAVVVQITEIARTLGLPLEAESLLTPRRGQVKLSKQACQSILSRYKIERVLAEEGGRTSRGSLSLMRAYVSFLNSHADQAEFADEALAYWIDRVREYFASNPLRLRYDASRSIRAVVSDILDQALERQQESPGTMYVGLVLQHLVGAKLEKLFPDRVSHFGASVADRQIDRGGDFTLEDVVVHVTTAPSESLIQKCGANLDAGKRPLIVTLAAKVPIAMGLAEQAELVHRIDVIDAEQFVSTNVHEWSGFKAAKCRAILEDFVETYNQIVETSETDPSLRLEMA